MAYINFPILSREGKEITYKERKYWEYFWLIDSLEGAKECVKKNGEFTFIDNAFDGNAFSPVGYQMLEGLQPGNNYTWRLLLQKRITKYLDANLNYNGRKSQTSNTIHTGSVQIRAFF